MPLTAKRTMIQVRCQQEFKLEVEEFAPEEHKSIAEVMRSAFRFFKSRGIAERLGESSEKPTDGYIPTSSRACLPSSPTASASHRLPGDIGGTIITERIMPNIAQQGASRFMIAADKTEPYKTKESKRKE